jgi:hypothetical protein
MSDPNIEGRILLALQALQNDPKLKLRRAAEIYHVGRMMLQYNTRWLMWARGAQAQIRETDPAPARVAFLCLFVCENA